MHYEQKRKSKAATCAVDPATLASSPTFVDDENASIRYMEQWSNLEVKAEQYTII